MSNLVLNAMQAATMNTNELSKVTTYITVTEYFLSLPRYPGGRIFEQSQADLRSQPTLLPADLSAPALPGSPIVSAPSADRHRPALECGESPVLVPASRVGQRGHQSSGQPVQEHRDPARPRSWPSLSSARPCQQGGFGQGCQGTPGVLQADLFVRNPRAAAAL